MKKNTMSKIRRICAGGLAALVMFTSVPINPTVYAKSDVQTEQQTEIKTKTEYRVTKIEKVKDMEVAYDTNKEKVKLPETLKVTLEKTETVVENTSETVEEQTTEEQTTEEQTKEEQKPSEEQTTEQSSNEAAENNTDTSDSTEEPSTAQITEKDSTPEVKPAEQNVDEPSEPSSQDKPLEEIVEA